MNTLQEFIAALKDGTVSADDLKLVKAALKPKTAAQIKKEEALEAIDAFKSMSMEDFSLEEYPLVGDILKEYDVLLGELKACGVLEQEPFSRRRNGVGKTN